MTSYYQPESLLYQPKCFLSTPDNIICQRGSHYLGQRAFRMGQGDLLCRLKDFPYQAKRANRVVKWAFYINQSAFCSCQRAQHQPEGLLYRPRGLLNLSEDLPSQGTFSIGQGTSYINQGPPESARGPPVLTYQMASCVI